MYRLDSHIMLFVLFRVFRGQKIRKTNAWISCQK
jgi:hypothetical protein